mmetsp:Transcript_3649/g.9824  ORF Transcript_3649/g.9824 Transcript_3649/m.9824 type:complete len:201 (-) Transcript_3649:1573-2175(-)
MLALRLGVAVPDRHDVAVVVALVLTVGGVIRIDPRPPLLLRVGRGQSNHVHTPHLHPPVGARGGQYRFTLGRPSIVLPLPFSVGAVHPHRRIQTSHPRQAVIDQIRLAVHSIQSIEMTLGVRHDSGQYLGECAPLRVGQCRDGHGRYDGPYHQRRDGRVPCPRIPIPAVSEHSRQLGRSLRRRRRRRRSLMVHPRQYVLP